MRILKVCPKFTRDRERLQGLEQRAVTLFIHTLPWFPGTTTEIGTYELLAEEAQRILNAIKFLKIDAIIGIGPMCANLLQHPLLSTRNDYLGPVFKKIQQQWEPALAPFSIAQEFTIMEGIPVFIYPLSLYSNPEQDSQEEITNELVIFRLNKFMGRLTSKHMDTVLPIIDRPASHGLQNVVPGDQEVTFSVLGSYTEYEAGITYVYGVTDEGRTICVGTTFRPSICFAADSVAFTCAAVAKGLGENIPLFQFSDLHDMASIRVYQPATIRDSLTLRYYKVELKCVSYKRALEYIKKTFGSVFNDFVEPGHQLQAAYGMWGGTRVTLPPDAWENASQGGLFYWNLRGGFSKARITPALGDDPPTTLIPTILEVVIDPETFEVATVYLQHKEAIHMLVMGEYPSRQEFYLTLSSILDTLDTQVLVGHGLGIRTLPLLARRSKEVGVALKLSRSQELPLEATCGGDGVPLLSEVVGRTVIDIPSKNQTTDLFDGTTLRDRIDATCRYLAREDPVGIRWGLLRMYRQISWSRLGSTKDVQKVLFALNVTGIEHGVTVLFHSIKTYQMLAQTAPRELALVDPASGDEDSSHAKVSNEGGYHFGKPGVIASYVSDVDFAGYYPALISGGNIDPLTFVKNGATPELPAEYDTTAFGLAPTYLRGLYTYREQLKQAEAPNPTHIKVVKLASNIVYGVLGRLFPDVGAHITLAGRLLIRSTIDQVLAGRTPTTPMEVVLANTDGFHVSYPAGKYDVLARHLETVNAAIPAPHTLVIKSTYVKMIIVKKVPYIGLTELGDLDTRSLAIDSKFLCCSFGRQVQTCVFQILMVGPDVPKATRVRLLSKLCDNLKFFFNSEDLGIIIKSVAKGNKQEALVHFLAGIASWLYDTNRDPELFTVYQQLNPKLATTKNDPQGILYRNELLSAHQRRTQTLPSEDLAFVYIVTADGERAACRPKDVRSDQAIYKTYYMATHVMRPLKQIITLFPAISWEALDKARMRPVEIVATIAEDLGLDYIPFPIYRCNLCKSSHASISETCTCQKLVKNY